MEKNKAQSLINILGLSVGMGVAILIGLWIWDELSFNKSFQNYDRLAMVMQHQTFNSDVTSQTSVPYLMGDELRNSYGSEFKQVSMSSWTSDHILSVGEKKITQTGNFYDPQITEMLSLNMVKGSKAALKDKYSIILSSSTAKALFGEEEPLGKTIKIDNKYDVKVTGVYEDLPYNSDFNKLSFISTWQLFIDNNNWSEKSTNPWRNNSFQTLVQLADHSDMEKVSKKIKDVKLKRVNPQDAAFKPVVFLLPMSKWHLYSEFKNGVNVGGRIEFVWLFGLIGFFVLLLACINFMNLSTARSEKRAKEVGIRKAIGSLKSQLVQQFFYESIMMAIISLGFSLLLVQLVLRFFNQIADKKIGIPWANPIFWFFAIAFSLITGLLAGSYPAFYLSSFQPVKVLKGTFRVGPFAALPRKVLVVLQFTVSVVLVVATIIVFEQIQFAKNRPVGYDRNGLVMVPVMTEDIHQHFDAVRDDLKKSGAITEIAESSSPTIYVNEVDNGFEWKGKDPSLQGDFAVSFVSKDFGKAINWKIIQGRDFSKDFLTDSNAIILNETAAKFTGLKNPIGETIVWDGKPFHVIGVINDMIIESPYSPVYRSVYVTDPGAQSVINIRINPASSTHDALAKIETVFKQYNPCLLYTSPSPRD